MSNDYTLDSKNENFAAALKLAFRKSAIADAIGERFLEAHEAVESLPQSERAGYAPQLHNLVTQRLQALSESIEANLSFVKMAEDMPDFLTKDFQGSIDAIRVNTITLANQILKSK